jgi:hypothetical protein
VLKLESKYTKRTQMPKSGMAVLMGFGFQEFTGDPAYRPGRPVCPQAS